ncbi:MAG: SRPBCC domain-containing protein [Actinobacteria bacterium]|nr:SRPBCC domain-containing protein [Actinomycetota bacterium]
MNVVRSVDVGVDPGTAFSLFTGEIGRWYRSERWSWNDPGRAVGIRIEPGIGGRWLEVWDAETGEGFELGRVLVWEPGVRLVVTYRNVHMPPGDTEIEVRFEPAEAGTRVTLEHRGVGHMSDEQRDNAWLSFMGWFRDYVAERFP